MLLPSEGLTFRPHTPSTPISRFVSLMTPFLSIIFCFFLCLPNAVGFQWNSPALPQQCSNLTVIVSGTDFVFPLKVLIVPVGPSPLNYEVRRVMEVDFPANATTVSFKLPYPTGSSLVVLVSVAGHFHRLPSTYVVFTGERCIGLSCWQHWQYIEGGVVGRCILL